MEPIEKDIIAALLKSVWEHDLISETTYRAALGRLYEGAGQRENGYPQGAR